MRDTHIIDVAKRTGVNCSKCARGRGRCARSSALWRPARPLQPHTTASLPRAFRAIGTIPSGLIKYMYISHGPSHHIYVSPHKLSNTHSLLTVSYHGHRERHVTETWASLPPIAADTPASPPPGRQTSWTTSNEPYSCCARRSSSSMSAYLRAHTRGAHTVSQGRDNARSS